MPQVIDPKAYIIGAADVYSRAIGTSGPWVSVGATVDDVVFRVNQKTFNPSEKFNGVLALIREMDYLSSQAAEAEFVLPQIAGPNLALALRSIVSTATTKTDAGGTPFSSTLASDSAIGATNIKVAAVTNLVLGDWIRIDVVAGSLAEYRQVTFVGTVGAGGTGVSFRDPLLQAHLSGVATVEATGDGKTEITPGLTRRAPLSAYNDWALVAQSPSDYYELLLMNAIGTTEGAEIAFKNEDMAGIKVTLGTRQDGSNLSLPAWKLRVPA